MECAQRALLAAVLYDMYTSDFLASTFSKYMYADNVLLRLSLLNLPSILMTWQRCKNTLDRGDSRFHLTKQYRHPVLFLDNHFANYRSKVYLEHRELIRLETQPQVTLIFTRQNDRFLSNNTLIN